MRLLLDTHAFLWWCEDSPRLRAGVRTVIAQAELVFVSAASAWEVAIKASLGKLKLPGPLEEAVEQSQFSKLPITFRHAAAVAALPAHHGDPFDRMIIAQAQIEGLEIVTHDPRFKAYRTPVLWD
jgi:PIN domain nuclease of toxin-antitoxin system